MVVTCPLGMRIPVRPRLQAKSCFVPDVEQVPVYLNVRHRRALPGRTADGGCSHNVCSSGSETRTDTGMNPEPMNPEARTKA
jgi:hypothetical protein